MPFHFNPSFWFVCKLCREAFPDTDKLKAHKLESHLGESLNIKCVVFEEKLLDHEWIPPSQVFRFKHDPDQLINLNVTHPPQNTNSDKTSNLRTLKNKLKCQGRIKFQNPYVSLKLLTAQELNSVSAPHAAEGMNSNSKLTAGSTCNKIIRNGEATPGKGDDADGHKNKVRELLNSAVAIKSEPNDNDDSTDGECLEPHEIPLPNYIPPTHQWHTTGPATTLVSTPHFGKVEFIEYDFLEESDNGETISTTNEQQQDQPLPQQTIYAENSDFRFALPHPASDYNNSASQLVSNKIQNSFVCPVCSASFSAQNRLTRHVSIHFPTKPYPCPHCDLKFHRKDVLRVHLIRRHDQATPFRCRHCGKYLIDRADAFDHEAGHTGIRPYKCDFPNCGAQLMSRSTVYAHKRSVHGRELGLPQFECSTCGKSFGLRKCLNSHIRTKHCNVQNDSTHLTLTLS